MSKIFKIGYRRTIDDYFFKTSCPHCNSILGITYQDINCFYPISSSSAIASTTCPACHLDFFVNMTKEPFAILEQISYEEYKKEAQNE